MPSSQPGSPRPQSPTSLATHDDYTGAVLDVGDVDPDPLVQLQAWLRDAEEAELPQPNAMVVATVGPDGAPSVRSVLLKTIEDGTLRFATHWTSRKGVALAHEPRVAVTFPWYGLYRQIHVEGIARRGTVEESDAYWATRPRGFQLGGWASTQSAPIADRDALLAQAAAQEERFADHEQVPRPPHWGIVRIEPVRVEVWQGQRSRLHDRLLYTRGDDGSWGITRLQP